MGFGTLDFWQDWRQSPEAATWRRDAANELAAAFLIPRQGPTPMTKDGYPDLPDDLIDAAWALNRLDQQVMPVVTEPAKSFLRKYLADRGYTPKLERLDEVSSTRHEAQESR